MGFDTQIAGNGYAWWYIDALSADGTQGITAIAFIGSVFSPYYAWARRGRIADPEDYCSLNVALYHPRAKRWAMTERGASQVSRTTSHISIGPSSLRWTGADLEILVDERCAPIPRRLRGSIRLTPTALTDRSFALDRAGLHRWTPYAPRAHVEVRFSEPSTHWSGVGYLDSNSGDEPLEKAFDEWTWSRASLPDRTVVLYDTVKNNIQSNLTLEFTPNGDAREAEVPARAQLARTRWGLTRATRTDLGSMARIAQTLEDAPFYSRSQLDTQLLGVRAPAIHESLSLKRFSSAWVQCLLPFRMPRIVR